MYEPSSPLVADNSIRNLNVTQAAVVQASNAQSGVAHIMPLAGASPPSLSIAPAGHLVAHRGTSAAQTNDPRDVQYHGGMLIGNALQHGIYVSTPQENCNPTCWGPIGNMQSDLGASELINSVSSEYLNGLSTANRYPLGTSAYMMANPTSVLVTNPLITQSMIYQLLFTAAVTNGYGYGYGHVYHVFLPPNTDTCVDATDCYSPDSPSTFTFCGYHSSVLFTPGNQYVVYTAQPYDYVQGCGFNGGVNALPSEADETDSQQSVLTHELFETITDPDVGSGWISNVTGDEAADTCEGVYTTIQMNATMYTVQSLWSDAVHLCTNG